jgi:hypothetical protein
VLQHTQPKLIDEISLFLLWYRKEERAMIQNRVLKGRKWVLKISHAVLN